MGAPGGEHGLKICHLTTVHQPFDIRIFLKECRSLASHGYDVRLVATHDRAEIRDGVRILPLPRSSNRLFRVIAGRANCLRRARETRSDLYQFHDPELIAVGLALKRDGAKAVYDVHESHADSILDRNWGSRGFRKLLSRNIAKQERAADKRLDAIVAATPKIAAQFSNPRTTLVQNYPMLSEIAVAAGGSFESRPRRAIYIGGVSRPRGSDQMVEAFEHISDGELALAGAFTPSSLATELEGLAGFARVKLLGTLDRTALAQEMALSRAGLVLFHPLRNHIEAQPNKLFEYMAAGLPVVASDFPYWRRLVEESACGHLADPLDPKAIGTAIRGLLDDPKMAEELGANGRRAVSERFNWESQATVLLGLMADLLGEVPNDCTSTSQQEAAVQQRGGQ